MLSAIYSTVAGLAANALALLGGLSIFVFAAIVAALFPLPAIALFVLVGVTVLVAKSARAS